jgi:hypothetical protein
LISVDCWLKRWKALPVGLLVSVFRRPLDWQTCQVGSGWRRIEWAEGARIADGAFLLFVPIVTSAPIVEASAFGAGPAGGSSYEKNFAAI